MILGYLLYLFFIIVFLFFKVWYGKKRGFVLLINFLVIELYILKWICVIIIIILLFKYFFKMLLMLLLIVYKLGFIFW